MKQPTISFLIPTLGREDGLKRCIDSIDCINYPRELMEVCVLYGEEQTVPEKVAEGVSKTTGEYIIFAANDTEFTPESINEALKIDKALVAFNTGNQKGSGGECEHFIIRRDFLPRIGGEIFDTDFWHCGVDNLLQAKAEKLKEFAVAESAIVNHYHFSKGTPKDEVYEKGWSHVEEDRALLEKKLKELK